jgi:beta-glucosidase
VALMKDTGANSYRFSMAWPRIFPDGVGQANPKGVDFYSRLVDEVKAAGIEPFATLYHWDLPQTLQDKHRGWQSKDTAKAFADYAGYIAGQLGDRVKHFFTINEFRSFVEDGYQGLDVQVGGGRIVHLGGAPGLRLSTSELNQVRHHAVLGHGLAVQAVRASSRPGTKVGFAENMLTAVPVVEAPDYVKAAEMATRELDADFTTVMPEGRYTDDYLKRNGKDAQKFTDDELRTIASPLDFVGINVYKPSLYVTPSDEPPGYDIIPLTRRTRRCSPRGTCSTPSVSTGRPTTCSRYGARRRSSSLRTAAARRMWLPRTARCTTPTGSCSCAPTSPSSSVRPPTAYR